MAFDRTLIAYVTKGGVTEETASMIANVLQDRYGLEVDLTNLRKNPCPDLRPYGNVIIGTGVRMQKVYGEALEFLENDFKDKRVAVFVSSLEPHDEAVTKYIEKGLANRLNVKPVAARVFGGRMKVLGKVVQDKRDMEKVKSWAEELGKKLVE